MFEISPGVCIQPTGLLQRHTTRSTREADETPAVGAERCRGTSARRRDHITCTDTATVPLATSTTACLAVLVFQCLTGQAPAYLADDCQLAADASARRLCSAT